MPLIRYYPANAAPAVTGEWTPPVDVIEQEQEFTIYLDMPGVEKDQFHLKVDEGILTISGERKRIEPAGVRREGLYEYFGRPHGKFMRTFRLPSHIDTGGIQAAYQNGVLEIHLGKTEEAKPKTIAIS